MYEAKDAYRCIMKANSYEMHPTRKLNVPIPPSNKNPATKPCRLPHLNGIQCVLLMYIISYCSDLRWEMIAFKDHLLLINDSFWS